MKQKTLYDFLCACQGNWRSAIYVAGCSSEPPVSPDNMDYLCAIDRDGLPCIVSAHELQEAVNEPIEKDECLMELSCARFRSLYKSYWDQYVDFPNLCGLRQLFVRQQCEKRELIPF